MPNKVFIDTSGWANLFVSTESYHQQAKQWFEEARRQNLEMINILLQWSRSIILRRTKKVIGHSKINYVAKNIQTENNCQLHKLNYLENTGKANRSAS